MGPLLKRGILYNDRDMPQYHSIQIRFIRRVARGRAETDPERDDILLMTRQGENSIKLVYTEKNDDGPVTDVMTYNHQQMLSYLYRAFWLLTLDEDPFQSVQLFLPGYPTCLILVTAIKENMARILDLIYSVCLTWPTIGAHRSEQVRTSRHSLLDQPGVTVMNTD